MPQGALRFQYQEDSTDSSVTALAGMPLYLELLTVVGLSASIRRHVQVRLEDGRAWTDVEQIMSVVLLNAAGGDCVDDIEKLNADRGLCRVLTRLKAEALKELNRQERRLVVREWEREGKRAVPSATALREYLEKYHDDAQEEARKESTVKAFIPKPNRHLVGLRLVNGDLMSFMQDRSPSSTATLDIDATLIFCNKQEALATYKGGKGYQPFNVWWAEQRLIVLTELRDGNVPAGYENLRVLIEALDLLPEGVNEVWLRSDTAAKKSDYISRHTIP